MSILLIAGIILGAIILLGLLGSFFGGFMRIIGAGLVIGVGLLLFDYQLAVLVLKVSGFAFFAYLAFKMVSKSIKNID